MKKFLISFIISVSLVMTGWGLRSLQDRIDKTDLQAVNTPQPRPLDAYTIENLSKASIKSANVKHESIIGEYPEFTSYLSSFEFDPTLGGGVTKKVTAMLNIPKGTKKYPVVVMLRGYVDVNQYQTGTGTKRAAEFFANNGYITIAPDFLGYGESSSEAGDIFETRFQTYTTAMTLLSSVGSIPEFDGKNIFIWAHSNGGQIALTTLEATGLNYPTALWAPVSKPFPYSVLYYTDEAEDKGKFLRSKLAKFEETYDSDLYSMHKYFDNIAAPILLQQGSADTAVYVSWSDALNSTLKNLGIDITYHKYPGADHNMQGAWSSAAAGSLNFFNNNLK